MRCLCVYLTFCFCQALKLAFILTVVNLFSSSSQLICSFSSILSRSLSSSSTENSSTFLWKTLPLLFQKFPNKMKVDLICFLQCRICSTADTWIVMTMLKQYIVQLYLLPMWQEMWYLIITGGSREHWWHLASDILVPQVSVLLRHQPESLSVSEPAVGFLQSNHLYSIFDLIITIH